jgi:hypothetical protein
MCYTKKVKNITLYIQGKNMKKLLIALAFCFVGSFYATENRATEDAHHAIIKRDLKLKDVTPISIIGFNKLHRSSQDRFHKGSPNSIEPTNNHSNDPKYTSYQGVGLPITWCSNYN